MNKTNNSMIKKVLIYAAFLFSSLSAISQQWGEFTLYSTQGSTSAYLIDTNGTTFQTWTGLSGGTGYSSYLMPGGTLWRSVNNQNVLNGGGMTGRVQKVAYNGTRLWDFTYSSNSYCLHHDICPLPNGNVLLISYDVKNATDLILAGYSGTGHAIWSEKIIEVRPDTAPAGTVSTTGTIVWEWKLWDHLTQNFDPAKANYHPTIIDHPELMNINYSSTATDWMHMNGIDYNDSLDQIVFSSHNLNEIFVIDHSTSTSEAAGHVGGNSGKGGDFLYRWGNPASYGATGTRSWNVVHDAHFIPYDCPRGGSIVGYNNNGISNTMSCVDIINPPYNGYNYLINPGSAYAPTTYNKRVPCNGHNNNMGNSQQLPNGNMLICIAQSGVIKEVDSNNVQLWSKTVSGTTPQAFRYSACFVSGARPATPSITDSIGILFAPPATYYQWYENGTALPGAISNTFVPSHSGSYQLIIGDINGCKSELSDTLEYVMTRTEETWTDRDLTVSPNPSNGNVFLTGSAVQNKDFDVLLFDTKGAQLFAAHNEPNPDFSFVSGGVYTISVRGKKMLLNKRIILVK
jgi:hypothetical protein